jgi:hypothetical protein
MRLYSIIGRIGAGTAVVVAAMFLPVGLAGAQQTPVAPFVIDSFSVTRHAGESFTVTGSGCPSTGTLPTSQALVLRLTPPTGGNALGASLIDGQVQLTSTTAAIQGEATVLVTPNADGTFNALIVIPSDAPPGSGYTVRGLCTTVLEAGPLPSGFSQASVDASAAQAGTLDVVATLATNPPSPLVVAATFTG